MSYQLDLDEFTEEELRDELARREEARRLGLCDYCGRNGNATKCRFPNRHPSVAAQEVMTDR